MLRSRYTWEFLKIFYRVLNYPGRMRNGSKPLTMSTSLFIAKNVTNMGFFFRSSLSIP